VGCKCALTGDRGENGVPRTRERDEERIALVIDLPPAMSAEFASKQPVMVRQDGPVFGAVPPEELRRALDVREKESCGG
jgi:hypothetical protein